MAGTYTDIVAIYGPAEAAEGETVDIQVDIKNLYSSSIHIYCVAVLDSENRFIDWQDAWVDAGVTHSFYGSFVMPNHDVIVNAYSYYEGSDGYLYEDDSYSVSISLKALPSPEFRGFEITEYVGV